MKRLIYIAFLIFFIFQAKAQNQILLQYYDQIIENSYNNQNLDTLVFYFEKAKKIMPQSQKGLLDIYQSYIHILNNEFDSALFYLEKAYNFYKENSSEIPLRYYNTLADIYKLKGDYANAIKNYKIVKDIALKNNYDTFLVTAYINLGYVYKKIGDFENALKYYLKALNSAEKIQDYQGYIFSLNNISTIHQKQKNYDKAISYQLKALKIAQEQKIYHTIPLIKINLAYSYILKNEPQKAYPLIKSALDTLKQKNQIFYYLQAVSLMGDYYKKIKLYDSAFYYYNIIIEQYQKNPQLITFAIRTIRDLCDIYAKLGDSLQNSQYYKKAIKFALQGAEMAEKTHTLPYLNGFYKTLMENYAKVSDFKNAFVYSQKYIETNEKLFNKEKSKAIQELEVKYEVDQYQKELEKQKILIEKQKMQKRAMFAIIILVIFIVAVVYKSYRQKKRDNEIIKLKNAELEQANEEIKVQRDLLQEQKEKIEQIHKKLIDSISYAQRIQTAALPSDSYLKTLFKEYFILFKPLQTVSGDFYWAKKISKYIVFTVADCTGHGVPGAFVSMLGISLLNEIVQRQDITSTAQVLEILRKNIKSALNQDSTNPETLDGMDMALCAFDTENNVLEYSGANRPIFIISKDGKLIEYSPVRNPVAFYYNEKPFTSIKININQDDIIYLFTDGYTDEINSNGKKFTKKQFKNLLLEIYDKPLYKQKEILDQKITEWLAGTSQIDDITVMGVRLL